jgi:hypothetical protein
MRSVLLAFVLAACGHGGGFGHGGFGHGGGGGFSHLGGGGGGSHSFSSGSHESHVSSSALSTVAHVARVVLPIAETVGEALLAGDPPPDDPPEPWAPATDSPGPLIDDHDACNRCPDDFACNQCTGAGGATCEFAPAGAHARCSTPR